MEPPSFSIKSAITDKELRFFGANVYCFSVELRGTEIHAVREVNCPIGASEFARYFSGLAAHAGPWPGAEGCESLEGDFSLSARCSALGVVTFDVAIHGPFGIPEEWKLSSKLTSELGQLPGMASAARRFFDVVAGT